MVKKSKKLLSVLLSVLMAVSCFALPFSISAAGVYDETVANNAKQALTAYESAMNGTVYKSGMKNAYDAYVALSKAYDEYVYGANYDKDLASATSTLTSATSAMSSSGAWSAYKGTAVPSFGSSNTVTSTDGYANLLYSNPVNSGISALEITSSTWSNRQDKNQIGYNATVMMYDSSTTPKMPVMYFSQFHKDRTVSSKPCATYSVFPINGSSGTTDHSNLTLPQQWRNNNKNADWNFDTNWSGSYRTGNNSTTIQSGPVFTPSFNSWGNWCGYSNVLELSNFDESQWTVSYNNLSWAFYIEGENQTDISKMQIRNGTVNDAATIQVFNYKKVLNAIDSAKSALSNISNYKNGSLSTVMGYVEKLVVDPNSFFTSGNGINDCVDNYKTPADNMASAISSAAKDQENYESLRNAIVAARANLAGGLSSYTYDSVESYREALTNAQNKFIGVDYTASCANELNALTSAKLLNQADLSGLEKVCDIIDSATFDISVYTSDAQAYLKSVKSILNGFYKNGIVNVAEENQSTVDEVVNKALTYLNVSVKEDTTDNPNTNLQNQKFTLTVNSNVDGVAATNSKSYAFGKVANINDVFDLQGYLDGSHIVSCVVSTPNSSNIKDAVIDLTMFDKTFFMQQDITVTLDIKTKAEGVVIIQGYDGSVITSYTGTAVLSEDGETLTVNGETVSPVENPTYTFTKWVKVSTADGTVVYKQVGSRISQANNITVIDGSISNTPESLNAGYTINYTGSDTFLAWVKIVGDVTVVDSYQAKDLVRYTSTEDSVIYIAITEQNIDSSTLGPNNDIKLSDDIKQTIKDKAPATYSTGYVANDKFVISGEFTNTGIDTSKYTITSVGVVISKTNTEPTKGGSACAAFEVKNYSSSGTFTASINSSVSTLYGRTYVAYTENVEGVGEVTRIAYGPVCTINK